MATGVIADVTVTPGPSGLRRIDAARTWFLSGLSERGSVTEPNLIRSPSEARVRLGGQVAYSDALAQIDAFFGEAAPTPAQVYFARDVGPAATVGTDTLVDRAGAPAATLRLDAADPGPWSSRLTYTVADGLQANTFTITLFLDGGQVEVFRDLASPSAAVTALANSVYARAADLGSPTAAPGNNPAVVATPTALSTGTDDRAAVTASTLLAALERLPADLGPGKVAIPGQPHSTVAVGLAAYAKRTGRVALTAPSAGTLPTAAGAAARALRTATGAEGLGFFYPHVVVPDGAGDSRVISPEGAVAGRAARRGMTWALPAGPNGDFQYVLGAERELTTAESSALDDDAVSTIRSDEAGVRLYGWRSLSTDETNFHWLKTADHLRELQFLGKQQLDVLLPDIVGADGAFLASVATALDSIIGPRATATPPAVYAGTDDPGYVIDLSGTTAEMLAVGQVDVELAIRDAPGAKLIRFRLRSVPITGTTL
jgi:hypothetical protein